MVSTTNFLTTLDSPYWRSTLLKTGTAVVATATVGTLLTDPDNRWYKSLDKPSWQPPKLAFPIAWTALYIDIVLVSALVIAEAEERRSGSSAPYQRALATNLALNAAWSGLFFRSQRLWLAVVEGAVLAASSTDLVRRAWASSPWRGVALAPYALWTGFATVLSTSIAWRNRNTFRH